MAMCFARMDFYEHQDASDVQRGGSGTGASRCDTCAVPAYEATACTTHPTQHLRYCDPSTNTTRKPQPMPPCSTNCHR